MKREKVTLETIFFYIGILGIIAAAGAAAIVRKNGLHLTGQLPPCVLNMLLQIPCPGCGGTRAVEYLLQGRFLASLKAHPMVLYVVFAYLYFMGNYAYVTFVQRERFSIYRLPGRRELFIGCAIVLGGQWIWKLVMAVWPSG